MSKDKQGELFPDEEPKKNPSTNPSAQSARRKRARKKSDEANKSENERVLERAREEWEALNKQVEENRSKLRVPTIDPQDDWQTNPDFDREKGGWQNRNELKILKSLAIGTSVAGLEVLKILNPFKPSRLY